MKPTIAFSPILFCCACSLSFGQSNVILEERPLVVPSYEIAPADPNPIFYTGRTYQGAQGHIYPYPLYDVLTDQRQDKTYKSVHLENPYIELNVMPELGGRIFSALDKTDNYDFFYRQHVVKPALIGMTGAWISGGVEWNIPHHHRASSMMPVDYSLQSNADGSKTAWVGETELRHRLKWTVGLTLYTNRSYVEATVKVINGTPYIHSFLYWANVSVHCGDDYQVMFPPETQFGVQHAKNEFIRLPIGDGNYGGRDRAGIDVTWWKNHPRPLSIFAWNFKDDFLAGYDFGKDAGTVHVANHQVVGGKKFFLWGKNRESEMWDKMLTEKDGPYIELMVGAYSDNQPDYSWIAPHETRVFKQYWYPIKKIDGVKNANTDAAVNLVRKSPGKALIGFNATTDFPNARVVFKNGEEVVLQKSIQIDPLTPFVQEIEIPTAAKDEDLSVALFAADGRELVSYRPAKLVKEEMPKPVERPRPPKDYASTEELYLTGLRLEQFHNAATDPLPYYMEALQRDPLDSRVNTVLGIHYAKEAKFAEAEKHLRNAIQRLTKDYTKPKDGEAFYYLGVVLQYQGRHPEAADAFWKATWHKAFQTPAFYALAQISCLKKDYARALELVDSAITTQANDTKSQTLKSYILRKLGRTDEALELAKAVSKFDHLDFWAMEEQGFAMLDKGNNDDAKSLQREFIRNWQSGMQTMLENVADYGNAGAYEEALRLLRAVIKGGWKQSDFPMLCYYAGYYSLKNGNSAESKQFFEQAAQQPSTLCFPFRPEEIVILETALKENPSDSNGHYYLGNLCYFLNQKEKGIAAWEQSVQLDSRNAKALRNLGFAYDRAGDLKKAIAAYEKCIAADPSDPRFFCELDGLYEKAGKASNARLALLEANSATVAKRDDAITRKVVLYLEAGEYAKAMDILTKRHFHVWEGGGDIHNIFVDACLLSGTKKMASQQYAEALKDMELANTYPDNLEVGEPDNGGRRSIQATYLIATAYDAMKNEAKARELYAKAAAGRDDGARSETAFYRALASKKLGKTAEADKILVSLGDYAKKQLESGGGIDFFSKFGEEGSRETRMAQNYYLLGLSYLGQGDAEKAKAEFAKTLKLNKNHIWAKVYSEQGLPK